MKTKQSDRISEDNEKMSKKGYDNPGNPVSGKEKSSSSNNHFRKDPYSKKDNSPGTKASKEKIVSEINPKKGNSDESHDKARKWREFKERCKKQILYFKDLLLGRTKKQRRPDKPNFLGKKFILHYFLFIFFSLILFLHIGLNGMSDDMGWQFLNIMVINNPYIFGIALTTTFMEFSFIFTNEKALKFLFGKNWILKQLGVFIGLMSINFYVDYTIKRNGYDMYTLLLLLAIFWLFMQSVRLYSGSRKFATRLETKWTEYYSPLRYFSALIIPYFLLFIMVYIMWVFRYFIVLFTLDVLGPRVPLYAFKVYTMEMKIIMPFGYVSVLLIFIFILVNGYLTRRKGDTKQAGAYDNLTYSIISFVMFLFLVYNILLYLFLNKDMLDGISGALGNKSGGHIMIFIEFGVTILFLIWIVADLSKEFKTGFLFFTNEGFVMFLFASIMSQTTARLGLIKGELNEISGIAQFLTLDYIMIPIFIILFLGLTLMIYYMNPRKTSLFLRINEAAVNKQDRSMEIILKFLKREFIRRGDKFLLDDQLISQIMLVTSLPKGVIWSLIRRLDDKYIDLQLLESEHQDGSGKKKIYVDFIPITERYQRDHEAELKAKQYMRNRFTTLITQEKRKKIKLYSGKKSSLSSSKQSDLFIQALGIQYGRKIVDEEAKKKSEKEKQLIIDAAIDEETKEIIYQLIKEEYIERIKDVGRYGDYRFLISEIAGKIERATRVSPGRLYPLLEQMASTNWNFNLNAKVEGKASAEDKLIEFLPIDDFDVYYALSEYRPEGTLEIRVLMQTWFERNIKFERNELKRIPPLEYSDEDEEFKRSYLSRWFAQLMQYFSKNYRDRLQIERPDLNADKFNESIWLIINGKLNDCKHKMNNKKQK